MNDRTKAELTEEARVLRDRIAELESQLAAHQHAKDAPCNDEAQARRQFAELDALYQNAPVALATLDVELRYVRVNRRTAAMAGRDAKEILGKTIREVLPGWADQFESLCRRVLKTGEALSKTEVGPAALSNVEDQRALLVKCYPADYGEGSAAHVCMDILDTTEHYRQGQGILASEERFQAVARATMEAIYDWDIPANQGWCNENFEATLGRIDGPPGQWWFERIHPEDRERVFRQAERDFQGTTTFYRAEYRFRLPSGEFGHFIDRGSILRDADGKPVRLVGALIDVTERARAAEDLAKSRQLRAEAEKLAATGRLAARIAHEINNPLAGIKNSFQLIKKAIPGDYPRYHYVERIEREIDRVARIVRQMFDLHRADQEAMRDVLVGDTLREVVGMLEPSCRQSRVNVIVEVPDPTLKIHLPEGSLRQVVYNLVGNAIEASLPGAMVTLVATRAEEQLRIDVIDHGQGIAPKDQERVFEPFFTTKDGGSLSGLGLGLPICKGIVDGLGGTLMVQSELGIGTTFHVILPLRNP